MRKKRLYMKPEAEAIQVKATEILAGSDPQAMNPNEPFEDGITTDWYN